MRLKCVAYLCMILFSVRSFPVTDCSFYTQMRSQSSSCQDFIKQAATVSACACFRMPKRATSILKQSSQALTCAPLTEKERKKLARLTDQQWHTQMGKCGQGDHVFDLYGLYEFPQFLTYLKTVPQYEDKMLSVGGFLDGSDVRTQWCQDLLATFQQETAEKIYMVINTEQRRIRDLQQESCLEDRRLIFTQDLQRIAVHQDQKIRTATFMLDANALELLSQTALDNNLFTRCTGTAVQIQKHTEILFLVNEFGHVRSYRTSETFIHIMYDFLDAARESNNEHNLKAANQITDFCWGVLEYTYAVGAGVYDGVSNVFTTLRHPVDTATHIIANVADASAFIACMIGDVISYSGVIARYKAGEFIGIEYRSDASQEWEHLAQKCAMMRDAIRVVCDEISTASGPERVRLITALGTEFYLSGKVYGKLLRATSSLYTQAGAQARVIAQEISAGISGEQAIAAVHGVEVRIANDSLSLLERVAEPSGALVRQGIVAQEVAGTFSKQFALLDPSIGDLAKLEKAAEAIKDIAGVLERDGPVTRLFKCGIKDSKSYNLGTAHGARYEIEKAYELMRRGEEVLEVGAKMPLVNKNTDMIIKTLDVDITTTNKLIECKNWDWSKKTFKEIDKLKSSVAELKKLAINEGKCFELHSKHSLPDALKAWLQKNHISFFEG